ncbi:hypothetical protein [Fictibacillus norfolkensis]|uniref:Uncharacterized protein n=1 Tax=Fictibacillus norfolkensis TaxID=2762233 RepID=A0ABR8SP79_9BACL|nr:hypothetical protein [Fictibacillus norfolkensis]MBD7965304.1 hypothetical protein [Fictibacillus norfolkensis]
MWWLLLFIIGILALAFIIDYRRKKRNDQLTNSLDPSLRQGEVGSHWNSGDGPNGF